MDRHNDVFHWKDIDLGCPVLDRVVRIHRTFAKMSSSRNSCQRQLYLPNIVCYGRNLEDLHRLGQQSLEEKRVEDKYLVGKGSILDFQVRVNVPGNEKYQTLSLATWFSLKANSENHWNMRAYFNPNSIRVSFRNWPSFSLWASSARTAIDLDLPLGLNGNMNNLGRHGTM